jgi:ABC-2 type transport system permease protein
MLVGAVRTDRRAAVRVVLGLALVVAATVVGCVALLTQRHSSVAAAFVVSVFGGSALTLGFAAAPLIAGAVDPLDPRRFVVFDIPPVPLATTLALAGVLSVPVAAVTALAVCAVVLWQSLGVPWLIAALGALLGVLTCTLAARVFTALAALVLRQRRSRERTGVFILALLVVVVPVGVFLASLQWAGHVPGQLRDAAAVLALTPVGAAWAIPALWAAGAGEVWIAALVALLTVAALAAGWAGIVAHILRSVERPAVGRGSGGLGWFAIAPGTPGGAVAARSLLYWLTDRRYIVNVVIVPVAALLAMVPLLVVGVPFPVVVLVPVPIMALFLGWLAHNDLAYDSTAVWMHIAAGVRGVSDRVGRLVPVLVIGIPVLAITAPVAIALQGQWALLPAMIGVCASLFLGGLGLSSISSALAPYPVTRPGDSPFQQPERAGTASAFAQAAVLVGALVVSAPALWWAWRALTGTVADAMLALWAGLGTGIGMLVVGVIIGSTVYSRRGPRLLEFAESA